MTKRLTAMLCALIFSLMGATAFAAEDSFRRAPTVLIKGWQQIAVQDVALDDANAGDDFLADALTYEVVRIGEDKLDKLSYCPSDDALAPDAHLIAEVKRYEKNRYWVEPSSASVEQRYTHTESYRDREGKVVGVLGVIGPTRLNYARVVPMVDFTARSLGKRIG